MVVRRGFRSISVRGSGSARNTFSRVFPCRQHIFITVHKAMVNMYYTTALPLAKPTPSVSQANHRRPRPHISGSSSRKHRCGRRDRGDMCSEEERTVMTFSAAYGHVIRFETPLDTMAVSACHARALPNFRLCLWSWFMGFGYIWMYTACLFREI